MNIKHPISVLTLTLTPFFIATGCSSTGGQSTLPAAEQPISATAPPYENQLSVNNNVEPVEAQETNTTATNAISENSKAVDLIELGIIDDDIDSGTNTGTNTGIDTDIDTGIDADISTNSDSELASATTDEPRPAKQIFRFGFDQAELSDEEKTIIQHHGRFLAAHPSQNIVIHGHADAQGDHKYNQFLSEKRAKHVAELLKQAGAKKDQIEIFSWSSDSPAEVATNYKANRRVELRYGQDYFAQKEQ